MTPLARFPAAHARVLEGIFFDLDDTVLTEGRLERATYDAMWNARDAGLVLVAVTGRPRAWGEVIAREWPVAGVVVENGALAIVRDGPGVRVLDPVSKNVRADRVKLLLDVKNAVARAAPDLTPADDAWCRVTDTTWDIGEKKKAPIEIVRAATDVIHEFGATSFASSVHLHASFDHTDKAQGAVRFAHDILAVDASRTLARYAFIGDSSNDASCFSAFHHSFGVANVKRHVARLPVPPRWVAEQEMGAGFAEILATLLMLRAERTD